MIMQCNARNDPSIHPCSTSVQLPVHLVKPCSVGPSSHPTGHGHRLRHFSFCPVVYVNTGLHPTIAFQTYKIHGLRAVHVYKWSFQPKESSPSVWIRGGSAPWETRGDGTPGDWTGKGPRVSLFWLFRMRCEGSGWVVLLTDR